MYLILMASCSFPRLLSLLEFAIAPLIVEDYNKQTSWYYAIQVVLSFGTIKLLDHGIQAMMYLKIQR